ncbi:hypothetical protein ATO13_21781 [Stappia sp. 22II-S9-Z10]|nr:hypothetical protein ATO13_21781 [Stappia sp. 22II-S9-Z10]
MVAGTKRRTERIEGGEDGAGPCGGPQVGFTRISGSARLSCAASLLGWLSLTGWTSATGFACHRAVRKPGTAFFFTAPALREDHARTEP